MSASIKSVIMAARLSLSPNLISSTDTVSFSFMIGTTCQDNNVWSVFRAFKYLFLLDRPSLVKRICATFLLCLAKTFSYSRIRPAWPTAATACLFGISFGLFKRPIFLIPEAIAPDETKIICKSLSISSQICLLIDRMAFKFNPLSVVSTPLPSFTTTRLALLKQFVRMLSI